MPASAPTLCPEPPDLLACLRGLREWCIRHGACPLGTIRVPVEGGGSLVLPLPPVNGQSPAASSMLTGRSTRDLRILLAVSCSPEGVKADRIAELIEEQPGSIFRGMLGNVAAPEARLLVSSHSGYRLHQEAVTQGVTPALVWAALSPEARHTTTPALLSLAESLDIPLDS